MSSSGGVLLDLLALRPWWSRHQSRWVSVLASDTEIALAGAPVRWESEIGAADLRPLAGALRRARRDLVDDRPDVIVSAGTGVAVAYFIAGRLMRIPTLWVETFNMIDRPGLAARLCARMADRVLVQRSELVITRRRAVFIGELY
ncbi:MAG: UDP-N-acetylglucosamine--LPS N-acetylglucosamine transferase [Nocardioides sp.]